MKTFADDEFVGAIMMISLSDRVEITEGNGENVGHQHFLLFPQCFLKPCSLGSLTLSKTSPGFYMSAVLVSSNFSFYHSVFYLFQEFSAIFVDFKIVGYKLFQFGRV